jgi:hypothetical protein
MVASLIKLFLGKKTHPCQKTLDREKKYIPFHSFHQFIIVNLHRGTELLQQEDRLRQRTILRWLMLR